MSKNIYKNMNWNLGRKYRLKLFDHAKQSATDALKTASKGVIQKIAEATSDLIHTKITKVLRTSSQNNNILYIIYNILL